MTWSKKVIQQNRAKNFAKRKKSHKSRLKRYRNGYVKPVFRGKTRIRVGNKSYESLRAPKVFFIRENCDEVLDFIDRLKDNLRLRKPTFVNFKYVEKIASGSIVILASTLQEFKEQGVLFNGNFPVNESTKAKFENSGFFEHIYNQSIDPNSKSEILTEFGQSDTRVRSELAGHAVARACNTVFGKEVMNYGLYRFLIEVMNNTYEHASPSTLKKQRWWLITDHNESENKVTVAFLDNGIGILKSFKSWAERKGIIKELKDRLRTDEAIFDDMMKANKSRTGLSYRGKGLPAIYDAFESNYFSDLTILSNNMFASFGVDNVEKLKRNFSGTLFYLELNGENKHD